MTDSSADRGEQFCMPSIRRIAGDFGPAKRWPQLPGELDRIGVQSFDRAAASRRE